MIALLVIPSLLAVAIAAAVWLWTPALDLRPTVRLLATLVATSTIMVVLQLALGSIGALEPLVLAGAAALVAAALAAGFFAWGRRVVPKPPGAFPRLARPTKIGLALGGVVAVSYLWLLFVGSLVPPYGWDAMIYHLTDVFHFARTKSTALFPYPSPYGPAFYFPKVGELHSAWFYILAGAGDQAWRVAGVGLIPAALTAAVATRAAAEGFGLKAALPWIVPGVMLAPVMLIQPLAGYVDVASAAFLLASFAFAILAATEGRFRFVSLACLAAGLSLGVKISFLYFGVPILIVLAAPKAWRSLLGRPWPRVVGRIALCVVLVAVGCGFWYGRNWVRTGNPLYPHHVKVAGITMFDGPIEILRNPMQRWFVPNFAAWFRYPFYESFHGKAQYSLESGFGPVFATGVVATAAALLITLRRRQWTLFRAMLAFPVTALAFLTVNPGMEPRYAIAVCGFGFLAVAVVADLMAGRLPDPRVAREPFQTPVGPGPMRVLNASVVVGIVFAAIGGSVSAAPDLGTVLQRWGRDSWIPQNYYPLQYGPVGETFNWLAMNGGSGTTVSYTNATFLAPLFGWHNRNRVVFAATETTPPTGIGPKVTNYKEWRSFLGSERVQWVVTWVPWWGEDSREIAEKWIARHPDEFPVLADFKGRARVYRPQVAGEAPPDIEPATAAPPGGERSLASLGAAEAWKVDYAAGAILTAKKDPGGGVRIDYEFGTPGNDYGDLVAYPVVEDWSSFATFNMLLEAPPQPTFLFVYLKGQDPRDACRYRIDLRQVKPVWQVISLDLAHPEWRTGNFDLSRVGEVHLVLDDIEDLDLNKGTLRVDDFRLKPASPPATDATTPLPTVAPSARDGAPAAGTEVPGGAR